MIFSQKSRKNSSNAKEKASILLHDVEKFQLLHLHSKLGFDFKLSSVVASKLFHLAFTFSCYFFRINCKN